MKELDKGHLYSLSTLDGYPGEQLELRFVKRVGRGYPGNETAYPGTTLQEVWRASIARLKYLDGQEHHPANYECISYLRRAIAVLEMRAAERHGRAFHILPDSYTVRRTSTSDVGVPIEDAPLCRFCLHVQCEGRCRAGGGR